MQTSQNRDRSKVCTRNNYYDTDFLEKEIKQIGVQILHILDFSEMQTLEMKFNTVITHFISQKYELNKKKQYKIAISMQIYKKNQQTKIYKSYFFL